MLSRSGQPDRLSGRVSLVSQIRTHESRFVATSLAIPLKIDLKLDGEVVLPVGIAASWLIDSTDDR